MLAGTGVDTGLNAHTPDLLHCLDIIYVDLTNGIHYK